MLETDIDSTLKERRMKTEHALVFENTGAQRGSFEAWSTYDVARIREGLFNIHGLFVINGNHCGFG